jgi:hypothetical protein
MNVSGMCLPQSSLSESFRLNLFLAQWNERNHLNVNVRNKSRATQEMAQKIII